jgi:uncharacterized membrane protein
MAVDVTTEIVIRRPVAEVAAYAGDPTNAPQWYANIRSVDLKTPPPVAQGSQMAFVATFLGRTLSYTYEVVELVAGERLTMRTAEGPFPMVTTYKWTSLAPDETRMTLCNAGTPSGFATVATPLIASSMRRAMTKDLSALKRILEHR